MPNTCADTEAWGFSDSRSTLRGGGFAEIGAAEVAKGVVSPPTPGTDAWRRAAVREAVYALRQRGLAQYVREAVNWTAPPR